MYHQLVNDGNFYYNKLVGGVSTNLIDNKLRLNGSAIFSMNCFDSEYRPAKATIGASISMPPICLVDGR